MGDQTIIVRLSANVAAFRAQMGAASAAVRAAGADAAAASAAASAGTKKIAAGMVAVGVAATAMAAASAAAAIQLETRMQNVATIWTDTAVTVEDAGKRVLDITLQLPQSANNLAEGLYDIASSGFQGAAGLEVLHASARAAAAGLSDTATAARGITAVLNAYGLSADEASTVSDILFQTVNLGVVTFEELANTMGDFVGSASVAGVAIQDANAALATMTLSGIGASEAGTALNRVMQEFIQPGEHLTKVLQQMGYATGLEAIEAEGLQGVMMKLNQATGGSATMMAQLFPEIRGLKGALALLSAEGENYNRVAALMSDETELIGATQRALDEQSQSTSFQFNILKNTVMESAITFGQSLLPAIKGIVGVFQSAIDIWSAVPGPLQTIIGVTGLLAAMLTGLAGVFILLAPAIMATGPAWAVFAGGVRTATTAVVGFLASMGPVGWAIAGISALVTVATGLWAKHKREQAETKRRVDALKESLDAQNGSLTSQTEELIRTAIVEDDLDKKAKQLGISLEDLSAAMLGDEEAAKRVNAALDEQDARLKAADSSMNSYGEGLSDVGGHSDKLKDAVGGLRGAVNDSTGDLAKARKELEREKEVAEGTEGALARLTRQNQQKAESDRIAAEEAQKHAAAMESLAKQISKAFDPTAAMSAAEDAYSASQDRMTDKAKQAMSDRHDAERDALDDTLELELERWEESARLRSDALKQAQDDELAALREVHEAALAALSTRHEEENRLFAEQIRERKNAQDDAQRAEKQALDDSIRDQRRAMDARLAIIDEEFAKRKKTAQKGYQAEKAELEWLIRTSWGAQRQAAIDRLGLLEESHEAELAAIEREKDARITTEKDIQSDSEREQKNGLDDRHRTEDQALADELALLAERLKARQDVETEAEKTRHDAQVEAAKVRHDAQKTALDNELKQLKDALDDDHEARRSHLQRVQDQENTKADERRAAARAKHVLSLGELQAQLDESNRAHETKLADLVAIWERSGRDLSEAMLTELANLDPKVLDQLANTGDDSFDSFMDSFGSAVAGVDPTSLSAKFAPFTSEIKGLLKQVGEYGGANMMEAVAQGLSNDPAGAERLRTVLADLMAPKQISPGVWAVPAPGGGYQPMRMGLAHGGIMRFADGGEQHVAQKAAAGAWRVWAEPETGGESYIPWALSKRPRSTAVLAQTAHAFGYSLMPMADGGMIGREMARRMEQGRANVMNHVEVQVRVAAGVDPDAVGAAVRREVERAMDNLSRQVTVRAWRN